MVKRKRPFVIDGGLGSRALDWNHLLLSVPNPRPGEANEGVLVGEFDLDKDFHIADIQPIWLNVRTGLTRPTAFAAPPGAVKWLFDSTGEPRLVFTGKGAQREIHWRGPGRTDWQLLAKGDLMAMPFEPHSVDDAGTLYVLYSDGPDGLRTLARYDFESKTIGKPLLSNPGFDFDGQLLTRSGPGPAPGVRVHIDAQTTVWFDAGMKPLRAIVDQRFPGRINRISCGLCTRPEAVALVRFYSDREPGQLCLNVKSSRDQHHDSDMASTARNSPSQCRRLHLSR